MKLINPQDEKTAEQFGQMRDTSKRFFFLLVILGGIALFGLVGARPAYRWFKSQRALAMVTKGEAAAATNDWVQVGRVVQTTLRLAPEEPRVVRLAARYCTEIGNPAGIGYWQSTETQLGLSLDDQIEYARLAVGLGRTDLSAQLLQKLVATNKIDPKVLRLTVIHAKAVGSAREALAAARRWVSAAPGDEEAEFALAGLLLAGGNEAERREGQGLLWGIALGNSPRRWEAIDSLAMSPGLSQGENLVLLKQIENRPEQLVTAYALRIKLHPAEKSELINALIKAVTDDGTTRQLALAAGWLADNGETKRVLDVLPANVGEKDPILMTGRLQALLETGQLAEVKRVLEFDTTKVEAFMLHCLRAMAAQKENKPQQMAGHFENALVAAGNNPARLRFVAGYAERLGQAAAAVSAYRRLMNWPPATVEAGRNILRLANGMNDTRTLRDTTGHLASYLPGDRNIAIMQAYFSALLNDANPRTKADLLRLAGQNSKDPEAALALALVEHRLGEHPSSLARIEAIGSEWIKEVPQRGAVYAAILAANDQREPARRLARSLDPAKLRPEELDLIRELRQ